LQSKDGYCNFNVRQGIGSHYVDKEGKLKVKAITLKTILKKIEKIDIMKMDIEGSELDVLKNVGNEIKKIDKAIIECHNKNSDQIQYIMKKKGYDLKLKEKGRLIYARLIKTYKNKLN
ncbi:MAG: FkbM family methyltransferase, partial [Candidatus Woesearchaeota archaeon]